MTRRYEVIRMAQSARLGVFCLDDGSTIEALERFSALVAADERERCAKESEAIRDDYVATGSNLQACTADYIACAIRALKDEVSE